MSKKKQEQKNDKFAASPFKALKGLALSAAPPVPPPAPVRAPEMAEIDFDDEMGRLGVRRIAAGDDRLPALTPTPPSSPPAPAGPPQTEEGLFLHAMQGMEVVFTDDIPEMEEPLTPSPRRMKLVEQKKLKPSARLDLHGCTRSEAREKVQHFLANARHHGYPLVLIITGWGKTGSGEAVLREEVARYLRTEGQALISEWSQAPPFLGGDGALLVFLKKR